MRAKDLIGEMVALCQDCPCDQGCLGWRVANYQGKDTWTDTWGDEQPLAPLLNEKQFWWLVERMLERLFRAG